MRTCRHCGHRFTFPRKGKVTCPECKKPSGVERACAICGSHYYVPPSSNLQTCSAECSSNLRRRAQVTHGCSRTRLYQAWCDMKSRCAGTGGPLGDAYYANRGIAVCSEWAESFEAFRDWALSSGYRSGLEIDRIDNSLGYCPANCRWATRSQQMANTRVRNQANKTSKYRGVSRYGINGKWRAAGNGKHLGVFDVEDDAARAYDAWAAEAFGEFASLNIA